MCLTGRNNKLKNLATLVEHNLGYQVFQAVEKTKIELSSEPASTFFIFLKWELISKMK
jgi:hypothetical chaperone protein